MTATGRSARYPGCGGSTAGGRLIDGPSLLWRCQLLGHVAPGTDPETPRVSDLARGVDGRRPVHLPRRARRAGAGHRRRRRRAAPLRPQRAGFDAPGAATLLPDLGNGLAAYVEGDHAKAADALLRFEPYQWDVGGSRAQREVFEDTLIHALVRAGRLDQAATRLRVRLDRRESALDSRLLAATRPGEALSCTP